MQNSTALTRWLALVRVATGAVFVYMSTTHLLGGVATTDGFFKMIGGFAKSDPLTPYTSVMVPVVLSAPGLFGPLFVFGMLRRWPNRGVERAGRERMLTHVGWHDLLQGTWLCPRGGLPLRVQD